MVASPSGTLVGVFDVGAGLSIGCHSAQQSGQRALGRHRYILQQASCSEKSLHVVRSLSLPIPTRLLM